MRGQNRGRQSLKKSNRARPKPPLVMLAHVPAPDAEDRLRRAFDLVVGAAARREGEQMADVADAQNKTGEEAEHDT